MTDPTPQPDAASQSDAVPQPDAAPQPATGPQLPAADGSADPHAWLEEVTGEEALG
jgi:prolyl oligopeptidase